MPVPREISGGREKMNMPTSKTCLLLITAGILLTGCGGDDSSSSSTSGTASPTISGNVIDGYIQGAKVCLDVNNNNRCDSDEISATTTEGGAFTLVNVPSEAASKYQLV